MVYIPNNWFFFNPNIKSNYKNLYKISKQTGVVFYNNNSKSQNDFFLMIHPYINWCKKKRIKFILPCSLYWANKYKAFGVFVENNIRNKENLLNFKIIKKKYFIASKIHNSLEANLCSQSDLIFISPVFKTLSHPKQKPLKICNFLKLCFFLRDKIIFALGGVNRYNYIRLKNKNLYGFGGISAFTNKI